MKTLASLAVLLLLPLFVVAAGIPQRIEPDVPTIPQRIEVAGCSCPKTGICGCGAGCDCLGGVGSLAKMVPGKLKMDATPNVIEEPGDVIVIGGVKHYRLGSAAARAVGLTAVPAAPVAQAWPMASFPAFGGFGGGFSGGACSGGS